MGTLSTFFGEDFMTHPLTSTYISLLTAQNVHPCSVRKLILCYPLEKSLIVRLDEVHITQNGSVQEEVRPMSTGLVSIFQE